MWFEADLPQESESDVVEDFIASLGEIATTVNRSSRWRLRFTEGLIVLVPMPDFSMPFNVVALSSTALTFFFGSLFLMTGAGKKPHWVTQEDDKPKSKWDKLKPKLMYAAFCLAAYGLFVVETRQLKA